MLEFFKLHLTGPCPWRRRKAGDAHRPEGLDAPFLGNVFQGLLG
jgi:hypothetical protein